MSVWTCGVLLLSTAGCHRFNPCHPQTYEDLERTLSREDICDEGFPWVGQPPNFDGDEFVWLEKDFIVPSLAGGILQVNLSPSFPRVEIGDCASVIFYSSHDSIKTRNCSFSGRVSTVDAYFSGSTLQGLAPIGADVVHLELAPDSVVDFSPPNNTVEYQVTGRVFSLSFGVGGAYAITDVKNAPAPSAAYRLYDPARGVDAPTARELEVARLLASQQFARKLILRNDREEREFDFTSFGSDGE
jgi:hypothetical protein